MAPPKARIFIMTGGVAAIVAVGAFTGASLGVERDKSKAEQRAVEATAEQQIAHLESVKSRLLMQRRGLEKKLDEIAERRAAAEKPSP